MKTLIILYLTIWFFLTLLEWKNFSWREPLLAILAFAFSILIWPIVLISYWSRRRRRKGLSQLTGPVADLLEASRDDLLRKITVEEAESLYEIEGVPFGYINGKWMTLRGKVMAGDELWIFRTPEESWVHLSGREGVALVRNGEVVAEIVTRKN